MPDHPRGYVRRGTGILKPDSDAATAYNAVARDERIVFDDPRCAQIIEAVRDLCERKRWRLHGVTVVWTHVHVLVSWQGYIDSARVRAVLKRAITTWLRDVAGERRRWLSRAGSVKRVRDRKHFNHLMQRYLPAHRRYGGRQWYEGDR